VAGLVYYLHATKLILYVFPSEKLPFLHQEYIWDLQAPVEEKVPQGGDQKISVDLRAAKKHSYFLVTTGLNLSHVPTSGFLLLL
jgi:hypothetical protein